MRFLFFRGRWTLADSFAPLRFSTELSFLLCYLNNECFFSVSAVAKDEKHNQGLIGQSFVTGDCAGSGTTNRKQSGDPEITSGSGKDGEDGVTPVALGGDYDFKYTKPEGEQDFDTVHGHKTDIPWNSGQGSGFDNDWQSEDRKSEGKQNFDDVLGHKMEIPRHSGEGSGFDQDWQYEDQKSEGKQTFVDDVQNQKTEIPRHTGEGSGFDQDWQYEGQKPEGKHNVDNVPGLKTEIPRHTGEGSGFDQDWQYEDPK